MFRSMSGSRFTLVEWQSLLIGEGRAEKNSTGKLSCDRIQDESTFGTRLCSCSTVVSGLHRQYADCLCSYPDLPRRTQSAALCMLTADVQILVWVRSWHCLCRYWCINPSIPTYMNTFVESNAIQGRLLFWLAALHGVTGSELRRILASWHHFSV